MRLALNLFIILIFFSCKKKEKIVETEKEVVIYQEPIYKWSRVKFFDQQQSSDIKNTVNLSGNRLFFYSTNNLFAYDSASNSFQDNLNTTPTDLQVIPVINNNYCTLLSHGFIRFVPTTTTIPVSWQNSSFINILNLDSAFYDFHFLSRYKTGEMIGNENNLIVPYHTASSMSNINYLCIKLKKYTQNSSTPSTTFIVDTFKKIKTNPSNTPQSDYTFSAIGSNFLVRLNDSKNYIINPAFDTILINNNWFFKTAFKYNNKQYAIVYTPSLKLASTIDEGLTWVPEYDLGSSYEYFNYSVVGNKLIAYTSNPYVNSNNIYEIILSPSGGQVKELVNDGLNNVTIRSVNMVNNRVFISTNNGVFERAYSEFIEYK
ncbi:MAG: hypothetical protein H0W73_05235 [Bacteroidetes bacterium]|nr:hypothetical protein [Bacteroidota bacterium]